MKDELGNIIYCDYGCGKEANYTLKNGKHCCESSFNKCESIKKKNSESCKKHYKEKGNSYNGSKQNLEALYRGSLSYKEKCKANIENEFRKDHYKNTSWLKEKMIEHYHIEEKCSRCGITEWLGEPIQLEVHHIDGNNSNNEIENLAFLCPNCHSITSNFRGRNINKGKKEVSDDELINAIKTTSNTRQALIQVGLAPKGANYKRVYELKIKNNLE